MIACETTWKDTVQQYIDDVLSGRLVVGKLERWAVDRHVRDLETSEEFYLDEEAATWACDWFLHIKHTQGEYAGQPFTLYPFQAFIVWSIFGWKKQSDNLRRFSEAFISVGRGNGKTPLGIGIVTQATGFDVLPDGTILRRAGGCIAATKRDQAKIGFHDLVSYIEFVDVDGNPSELSDMCDVYRDFVTFRESESRIEPVSSDGKTADGWRLQAVLKDELHAWSEFQREFNDKIDTAMGKFPQTLAITTTTAGNERSRIWKEQRQLCGMVLDPDNELSVDSLFAMVCEIDVDDDPLDETCWPKANPLMRHGIVKLPHLRKQAQKAKINANALNQFERFHCNREVSSADKPITAKDWSLGNGELPPINDAPCYAGVDLGWKRDLAAVAYVWQCDDVDIDGEQKPVFRIEVDAYIPKGGSRNLDAEPWRTWIDAGLLTVTDSVWTDPDVIFADLRERSKQHGIASLAYDPNNFRQFAVNATNDLGLVTYPFQQTCKKYNEPVQAFLQAVGEGRIKHGGNSLLAWCATNLILRRDAAGHAMPDKEFSEEKIDPIVAVIMAISEALFAEPPKKSIYETRGPLVLDMSSSEFEEML